MQGFYITISNGLLKDGHRKRMGSAVWEFMWMLDKITRIDEDGIGWVVGGHEIKLQAIATDLETHPKTVSENIIRLEEEGYIEKQLRPHGMVLKVKKAKKRFRQNTEPLKRGSAKTRNQVLEKTEPPIRCKTYTSSVDNTSLSLTREERETVAKDLKRLFPGMNGIPKAIPYERAYLFLHKVRTGEIRKEQIYSPVAYMRKMLDEDITPLLEKERAKRR